MITWKYNRKGHVEIWDESVKSVREADLYLQTESDISSFFESIGVVEEDVSLDEWDVATDPGYFY